MASELRQAFQAEHPDFPWLEAGEPEAVEALLRRLGWIDADERVLRADKAGEGNMNLTLRVETPRRTVILKQARPWVEKYDHIEAPWDRIYAEQSFYRRIDRSPELAAMMPRLLGANAESRVLLLEDLAPAKDMTELYQGADLEGATLDALAGFLKTLHGETRAEQDEAFQNLEMRRLNHAHIFHLPLSGELDLPLDDFEPGLGAAAQTVIRDSDYVGRIREAGERYLSTGECLAHGDYFPGSWLLTGQGPRIIDPEFCFLGDPEFDLGVAVAHLALARRPVEEAGRFLQGATAGTFDAAWVARFAAAEVMRRLIGVAQLPIAPSDGWRAGMLDKSVRAAKQEVWEALWS